MWKLHKIQISVSSDKVVMEHQHTICLSVVYGFSQSAGNSNAE